MHRRISPDFLGPNTAGAMQGLQLSSIIPVLACDGFVSLQSLCSEQEFCVVEHALVTVVLVCDDTPS